MYKNHQDAELVDSYIEGNKMIGEEEEYQVPLLSESVSVDEKGYINVTLNNLSVTEDVPVEIALAESIPMHLDASILQQEMHAHNTFDEPENVKEKAYVNLRMVKSV